MSGHTGSVPSAQFATMSLSAEEKGTATVIFDDAKTNLADLIAATTNAGYPSRPAQP